MLLSVKSERFRAANHFSLLSVTNIFLDTQARFGIDGNLKKDFSSRLLRLTQLITAQNEGIIILEDTTTENKN